MCFSPQWRALFRHRINIESPSNRQKVVRTTGVLTLFTSRCASRRNSVHFFGIATSKNRPERRCFVHFHFEMCFAPQRCALFPHLNIQKSSEPDVFCFVLLPNVFAPQRRALFPHLNFQKWPEHVVISALSKKMCFAPQKRQFFNI